MEEDGEDLTPFWLQSTTNRRRSRRLSSLFLNSGLLVLLLCVVAFFFMFFIIPSILSLTSRIFRPNLVKKSWDSLNLVLVVFALVFGFISRNRNNDSRFDEGHRNVSEIRNGAQKSNPSTPHQWYEYSDRTVLGSSSAVGGLRRISSSYPDLRETSPWVNASDDRWRFSDDTQVEAHRYSDSDQVRRRRSWKRIEEEDEEIFDNGKTIHVDTLVTSAEEDSYTPPPPASPPLGPPLSAVHRKPKRAYESIAHNEKPKEEVKRSEPTKVLTSSVAPPPSPPPSLPPQPRSPSRHPAIAVHRKPKRAYESIAQVKRSEHTKSLTSPAVTPPPPPSMDSEKKSSKIERKRSGGTATKDFLASLYHQSNKKKKQRQKSAENFETLIQPQASLNFLPPSSPPQPPPPPPPAPFQNLFSSKKGKTRKTLSVPPPSLPQLLPSITTARASKNTALIAPIASRVSPLPMKISSFNSVEENSNSGGESPLTGNESPLIRIPPPPPPFKLPSWRFVVKGDYVRVGSMNCSRSGSPDHDDVESPTSETSSEAGSPVDSGEAVAPLFCASPDVDTKADVFIAKFRAGLKLQKADSLKRKQGLGLSNLGPETKPAPAPAPAPGPAQN